MDKEKITVQHADCNLNDLNELVSLYKSGGSFNMEELDYIAHARRGECFMISSPSERGSLVIETTDYIEQGFRD